MAKAKPATQPTDNPPASAEQPATVTAQLGGAGEGATTETKPEKKQAAGVKAVKPKARICDGNDRAGEGLRRYKIRLDGHPSGARSQRYVLAPDRDSAEACYLDHEKVEPEDVDGKSVKLVVTELPD